MKEKKNYQKAMPGRPPKRYNKDKSIGLFILRGKKCIEAIRGRVGSKGDVYTFCPQDPKGLFHESFHISGKFHWRIDGKKVFPLLGGEDAPLAFRTAVFKLGLTPCFCLRRGKRLNSDEAKKIIQCLIKYLPEGIKLEEIVSILEKRGFYRAHILKVAN